MPACPCETVPSAAGLLSGHDIGDVDNLREPLSDYTLSEYPSSA